MATLSIVEFASSVIFPTGSVPIALAPPVAMQTVTLSGSSQMCVAFNGNTNMVRVQTDTNCAIAFAPIGTTIATTVFLTSLPLAAGNPEYFGVIPGTLLAAIAT